MEQRERFIGDFDSCLYSMPELCERYGGEPQDGQSMGSAVRPRRPPGPFASSQKLFVADPSRGLRQAIGDSGFASDVGTAQAPGLAAQAAAGGQLASAEHGGRDLETVRAGGDPGSNPEALAVDGPWLDSS
jgi:hypothetical protein